MILHICNHLLSRGYNVDLILSNKSGEYTKVVDSDISIIDLDSHRQIACLPNLTRHLATSHYNALLSTGTGMNVIALLAKHFSRTKSPLTIRIQNNMSKSLEDMSRREHKILPILIKYLFPTVDNIIAISEGVANDLKSWTRIKRDEIDVVYNPVVTDDLFELAQAIPSHEWLQNPSKSVILGVGRLTKQKDFSTLIKAFARLRDSQEVYLVILGKGEDSTKLKKLAEDLGVSSYVSFPGFVDNPYAYMNSADIFVQTPIWEGFGNVLVEAMACGTPVVSTDCPHGPREILEDGRYGMLVPVGDHQRIAGSIEFLLKLTLRQEPIQERAKQFSLGTIGPKYESIILEK